MARKARELSKSGMYRVTLRGEELFKSDADKAVFRELLTKYFETGEIYGMSLEKTEIDLVVKEGENGISMTMKPLITSYARYFNKTHSITGKLFSDRFISVPIETEEEKAEGRRAAHTGTQKRVVEKKTENNQPEEGVEKIKPRSLPSWLL